jgi:predicted lysophospholipase L1 biosynthesis ABC-type transport system permease subunit
MSYGKTPQQVVDFYKEAIRRIDALPGVSETAFGNVVPWRDASLTPSGLQFSADGHVHAAGVEDPRAQWRVISPGFFAALGVPVIAGRDFNALDNRNDAEPVVIVSETLAQRMFPNQPVEHAATLEDIRAEVLTPDRLDSLVFGVFAVVALAIAVVGVAGVLAFSVSARTREFGIRLALGSEPQRLLKGVIAEGAVMAAAGVVAGAAFGFVLAFLAGRYFLDVKMPGALPVFVSAFVLMAVAVIASVLPAARAARVDVMQALRSE